MPPSKLHPACKLKRRARYERERNDALKAGKLRRRSVRHAPRYVPPQFRKDFVDAWPEIQAEYQRVVLGSDFATMHHYSGQDPLELPRHRRYA